MCEASTPPPASTATRGRPRDARVSRAVLEAAFALLAERGWAGFAIESVAARAGVGKATIYRHWPGHAALAVDAFFVATEAGLAFPDTGSAREDFRLQVHALAELLRSPVGQAFVGLVAGAKSEPAIARAVGERWVAPRMRWGVARLERAAAAGECAATLDIEAALGAIYSPLYAPFLLGRGVEPPPRVEAYLAIVFAGIFPLTEPTSR